MCKILFVKYLVSIVIHYIVAYSLYCIFRCIIYLIKNIYFFILFIYFKTGLF